MWLLDLSIEPLYITSFDLPILNCNMQTGEPPTHPLAPTPSPKSPITLSSTPWGDLPDVTGRLAQRELDMVCEQAVTWVAMSSGHHKCSAGFTPYSHLCKAAAFLWQGGGYGSKPGHKLPQPLTAQRALPHSTARGSGLMLRPVIYYPVVCFSQRFALELWRELTEALRKQQ